MFATTYRMICFGSGLGLLGVLCEARSHFNTSVKTIVTSLYPGLSTQNILFYRPGTLLLIQLSLLSYQQISISSNFFHIPIHQSS